MSDLWPALDGYTTLVYLWQGLLLGGAAAAQPGPFQAYLLSQTLRYGGWRTLPASLAPLISDGPIIALVLLLLTQMPDWFVWLLRLMGGLFLLYLAWGAWRSFRRAHVMMGTETAETHGMLRGTFKAALINALSPNPYIFWATIAGPILLAGWRQTAVSGLAFLLGFYAALMGGFAAFVALFAFTGRLDARLSRALSLLSALALCAFGLWQLWLAATGL